MKKDWIEIPVPMNTSVRRTYVNHYVISTVLIGETGRALDNLFTMMGGENYNPEEKEYETLVFLSKDDEKDADFDKLDIDQDHYETEEEAIEGHIKMCEKYDEDK